MEGRRLFPAAKGPAVPEMPEAIQKALRQTLKAPGIHNPPSRFEADIRDCGDPGRCPAADHLPPVGASADQPHGVAVHSRGPG